MTTANDALFEPFDAPKFTSSHQPSNGILKRSGTTAVEIMTANPKSLYTDIAAEVMDYACTCFPQMSDVRNASTAYAKIPIGALNLIQLVDRFYNGDRTFWVAAHPHTQPHEYEFVGRFGHFKVCRFPQQVATGTIPQFVADWFWLDTTEMQMSAVELGLICVHPKMQFVHMFDNQTNAQRYFTP
jgi:hypothetical protein